MIWTQRPAPYTGFGDATNTSVKFTTIRRLGEHRANWSSTPRLVQEPVAVSTTRVITQTIGRSPYEIGLTLWLPTLEALAHLDALQGTRATLWLKWDLAKPIGADHARLDDGVDYAVYTDTLLLRLSGERELDTGYFEVNALFQRAYHNPTLRTYGPYPAAPDPEAT